MNYKRLFSNLSKNIKKSDLIPGGKADNLPLKNFTGTPQEKEDLAKGLKHEMEHTDDPHKALEIAEDHEVEQKDKTGKGDYYEQIAKNPNLARSLRKLIFSKIRKHGDEWQVTTEDGSKVLGTHPTREEAVKQLQAIEISKHSKGK